MALLNEESCSSPLNVPPRLPIILKQFCKAAIRTQPYDLLKWSSAYFRALAEGVEPPTKIRLEYPVTASACGLTLGFLKVLLRQFGDYNKVLTLETVLRRWDDLSLDREHFNLIVVIGRFRRKCQVKKFLAIAAGLLGSSLLETMFIVCDLFTMEPDGGSAMIPASLKTGRYLAGLRCDGEPRDEGDEPDFVTLNSLEPRTPDLSDELSKDFSRRNSRNSTSTDPGKSPGHEEPLNSPGQASLQASETAGDDRENVGTEAEGNGVDSLSSAHRNPSPMSKSSDKGSSGRRSSSERRELNRTRKKSLVDSSWMTHHPNVPGIGPRLTAEEVASVRNWINECATVQEGMVGPRNLRHFQCPPLGRLKAPSS